MYRSLFQLTRLSFDCQLTGQIYQITEISGRPGRFHSRWPLFVNTEELRHHPWFLLHPKEGTACRAANGFTITQKGRWPRWMSVSELAFVLKVWFSPSPFSSHSPEQSLCLDHDKQGGRLCYGASNGTPNWVPLFPVVVYLIRDTVQPWTRDPGTLGLHTSLVRFVSCISACFPVPFSQHILSLLKGVSVFYSNVEHTLLKCRRLKSPEDTYHRGNLGKRLRRWVIFSGFCWQQWRQDAFPDSWSSSSSH